LVYRSGFNRSQSWISREVSARAAPNAGKGKTQFG
jgi:hypothetical protein